VTDRLAWGSQLLAFLAAWRRPTAVGAAVACALATFSYFAVGYFHYKHTASRERFAAQRAEQANLDLQHELDRLRDELAGQGGLNTDNDEANRPVAISEQDKTGRIAQLTRALEQTKRDLQLATEEREKLAVRLAAPAVTAFAQIERVLTAAGVDVKRMLTQFTVTAGTGGPLIAASAGHHAATPMSLEKLAALRMLIKELPVSAPLERYELSSSFGVRSDPITGHSSQHAGIDLKAPYLSPVYATAKGVVTYSGYRRGYGKVVEIDHGNGISTLYAHLHRQTVSVSQRVAAHSQIGFLGSTGRSTGPHVHYEVLVNGEPQDPEKFLGLTNLVATRDDTLLVVHREVR
jgi:murein DD-endopeptidase MepM/ murein hydrolase activator NlpD